MMQLAIAGKYLLDCVTLATKTGLAGCQAVPFDARAQLQREAPAAEQLSEAEVSLMRQQRAVLMGSQRATFESGTQAVSDGDAALAAIIDVDTITMLAYCDGGTPFEPASIGTAAPASLLTRHLRTHQAGAERTPQKQHDALMRA
jgi:hypothetical protein